MTDRTGVDDPVDRVDAQVTAMAPGARSPAVRRCDVVLVTGPWLAGVTGVAVALRERLPQRIFVEATDLAAGEVPAAVVFVVSAAAALTDSDCLLLDAAVEHTDAVIGVVSKIDVHRHWRQMLQAARETLAAHAPHYRDVVWIAAAAAPAQGEPRVHDLVAEVAKRLDDKDLARRNRLRAWESQLRADTDRMERDAEGVGWRTRVTLLQQHRDESLRARRLAKSERAIALRSRIAQARVQLTHFARKRCSSVRGELAEDAAGMTRRRLPEFEAYLRGRVAEVVAEVDQGVSEHLTDLTHELSLTGEPAPEATALPVVEVTEPALKSRRSETQLMMLLGLGFGLGVAVTLSRLVAHLAAGLTVAGAVACAAIGLAVAAWVVQIRGLLRDRAVLDRWVGEVIAALRAAVEELVALRVVSADSVLTAELAERDEADTARVADEVAGLGRELREHAAATARAAARRDRELPALQRVLDAVREQLGTQTPADTPAPGDD